MAPRLQDIITKKSWFNSRKLSTAEQVADGIVHGAGLLIAIIAGATLLNLTLKFTAPEQFPALLTYIVTMVVLFGVSMASNLWPHNNVKMWLARFDQAAIFLFIAGTYTPLLSLVWGSAEGLGVTVFVWSAALIGIALKLIVPQHFGRLAILLYLAIGWSGVLIFQDLANVIPSTALWLLVAGGVTYSAGITFYLWEKLKFNTAIWHTFVVVGASLHLIAIFDVLVFNRWALI